MIDIMDFLLGGGVRIKLKPHEYVRTISLGIAIFALIILSTLEIKHFHNTYNISSLVFRSMLFALLPGILIGYVLTKNKPKMELLTKFQIWVAAIILCLVFAVPLASMVNRWLAFNPAEPTAVELVKTAPFYSSRFGKLEGEDMEVTGYYLFFIKDDELKRLKSTTNPFEGKLEGEQVMLPIKKGFLGYEFVVLE